MSNIDDFVSKSQKGSQNDQKSIRFFTKSGRRFATLRNVKKALVLDHFGASKKVDQNTL